MLRNLTGWHALVILAVVLLVFGAARLPALARSVGLSMRILRDETRDGAAPPAPAAPVVTAAAAPVPSSAAAPAAISDVTSTTTADPTSHDAAHGAADLDRTASSAPAAAPVHA